ncbi:MAG: helix-turn-helix domain-containing protein [Burkholderiaceae bacterium]
MKKQTVARRMPRQARAREKVSLMFEAAVRILEEHGLEALTTNRVAALAGVSIGTLYQYFPNREALLEALARREVEQVFEALARLRGPDSTVQSGEAPLRESVRARLGALGGRLRARRALVRVIARSGRFESLLAGQDALAAMLLESAGDASADHEMNGFVLNRAVGGAIRGALMRDENMLASPEFEDALVRLIGGYLTASGSPLEPPRRKGRDLT